MSKLALENLSTKAISIHDRWLFSIQRRNQALEITKDTRVANILEEYGDIADVMEVFGIKRVGRYSIRALAAKAVTVEWAARIHRVPLDEFLAILHQAVSTKDDKPDKPVSKE
jgi:hypothetical protein